MASDAGKTTDPSAEFRRGMEAAAAIADLYGEENFLLAGDTVLIDPVLRNRDLSPAALAISERLQSDGHMHTSMAHGAKHIAAAIREAANGKR